ncbi:putative phospholipase B-like 2 [Amblyomma americanum]
MNYGAALVLLSLALLRTTSQGAPCKSAWAELEEGSDRLVIHDGKPPRFDAGALPAVAWASFQDDIQNSGWAYLEVESSHKFKDDIQAYAAGALEAHLTRQLMEHQWENLFAHYCDNQMRYCAKLYDFLQKNLDYSRRNEEQLRASDPYWNLIHLEMQQMRGLSDAFDNITLDTSRKMTNVTRALFFNLDGDFLDLEPAFKRAVDLQSISLVPACTALVKLVGNYEDIYIAHNSWFLYRSMLRIQKKYTFPWHYKPSSTGPDGIIPGHTLTMSSYAGNIVSLDDFYLTSAGLVVTETSTLNANPDLWLSLDPELAPLTWVRGMVATRLARSGREWVDIFERKNSGTYNNQWLILDYKLFTPGNPFPNNTLWVLEQMPKIMRKQDISDILRKRTYWPSYNVPYFEELFNMSGQAQLVEKYGDYYSYDKSPRANIFRRDHVKVRDIDSMVALMRYNDYTHDPFSRCNCTPPYNPVYAVSARYDLIDPRGKYGDPKMYRKSAGGIDVKVTNYAMFKSMEFVGVSGPPSDSVPVFQWSTSGFNDSHNGHPDRWNFGPVHRVWGSCAV